MSDMGQSAVFWISAYGAIAVGSSILAGILAGVKNRDYSFWMGWCLVLPPLVLFLAALPDYNGPRPRQRSLDDEDADDRW
ncbi:MAG: hypothetical protein NW205_00375 [Hyphomicrobiaceae bacterium]|nr:hypothetical protein [Hyphomicrobiaceae bacterium]